MSHNQHYVAPHPGCRSCGRQPGPWFAPSDEWNLVIGGPEATDDPGGILCATCYIDLAQQVYPYARFELRALSRPAEEMTRG